MNLNQNNENIKLTEITGSRRQLINENENENEKEKEKEKESEYETEEWNYPKAIMGTVNVKLERKTDETSGRLVEIVTFKLSYNGPSSVFEWEITKTLKSLKQFAFQLQFEMFNRNISMPSKRFHDLLKLIAHWTFDQLRPKTNDIKEFIDLLGASTELKHLTFVNQFFEVSRHSFIPFNNGIKPKEGYIYKQTELNQCQKSCISMAKCFQKCSCTSWVKCWFLLKPDMICYLDKSTSLIGKGTFWFDKGVTYVKKGNLIVLKNLKSKLVLNFMEEFERDIWYSLIQKRIEEFKANITHHQFNSFAGEKTQCKSKSFIDGEDYFQELSTKLIEAKETVFITDWWMSPEVFLKRPVSMSQYNSLAFRQGLEVNNEKELSRLCDILNYIAKKGVKVYVLLYCEVEVAIELNSKHTKLFLTGLDENISVTRHPKTSFDLFWSHHEKLVIIDQKIAFVGGLDLCWGRYDNTKHLIAEPENKEGNYCFPGIDYSNARISDFSNITEYLKESVERIQPRMPWHDIHSMVEGPAVLDISRHFVERWNHAKTDTKEGITDIKTKMTVADPLAQDPGTPNKKKVLFASQEPSSSKFSKAYTKMDTRSNALMINQIALEEIKEDKKDKDKEIEESNFHVVKTLLEMPNPLAKSTEKKKSAFSKLKNTVKKKMMSHLHLNNKEFIDNYVNLKAFALHFQKNERKMKCQCLRSLSFWSGGLEETEHSVLNAYMNLIDNAQHYIYIENQFFISRSFTDEEYEEKKVKPSNLIINEIALMLYLRIRRAYEEKQKFKVIILIPLLPGFAGEIPNQSTLQVILKYTYNTISRNSGLSLVEKLIDIMGDQYNDYIRFFSLRQHGMVNDTAATELIYIHSKLMIVDDVYVIMGSANINDRSMIGDRDSEFCVLYKEDPPNFDTIMNGKPYKASFFAHTLRMRLWTEHMGIILNDKDLIQNLFDPLNDCLLNAMNSRAKTNTEIFREVFNCYPDDKMKNFKDLPLPKILNEKEIENLNAKYEKRAKDIKGHIVEFPLWFLENELLKRSFFSAEILLPIKFFT